MEVSGGTWILSGSELVMELGQSLAGFPPGFSA